MVMTVGLAQKVIVALDTCSVERVKALVEELGEEVGTYKVGAELFTAHGPGTIGLLKGMGKRVFLDLKYHDIPNTVARAVAAAAGAGVDMLTVHIAGGTAMLRAARRALDEASRCGCVYRPPSLIGVIREACGPEFIIVPPGIRSPNDRYHDQRRVYTAREAFEAGADYIVVGRPVTRAERPRDALRALLSG